MDFIGIVLGRIFLNFIGGNIRWIFGTIWRKIFDKEKFTYNEYLFGPIKSNGSYDEIGHTLNNKIIGAILLFLLISFLIAYL